MGFLIACPNCGERDVSEFRFGGELNARPAPDAGADVWAHYLYARRNEAGPQTEWWFHRLGCRRWFLAQRDTRTNVVAKTWEPTAESPGHRLGEGGGGT